jgi:prepilin-type N-terminal cleavage/methylation domain-containing protein
MIRARRGYTFVELLMVLIVLSLLSGLAVLKYIDLRHRALSAQAASDLETVRLAAYSAWYETGRWPAEVGPGIVPAGMAPYLAKGFEFARPEYTLDWENFAPPDGGTSTGMQIGVVITTSSTRLQRTLEQVFGNRLPFIAGGGSLTFVIVGPDGKS